jgi:hypothetical protein
MNGQRLYSPNAALQQMPFCDNCNELIGNTASVYTELAPDKWWKWLSYPRFSCEEEALMGCERHPVEPEIHFLDGTVESFTGRLPSNRWQHWKWHIFWAVVFAIVAAFVVDRFFHFFSR